MSDLSVIKWHDLPIRSITISESALELVVLPYNEESKDYEVYKLTITQFVSLNVDMKAILTARDLGSLEVSKFDFEVEENLITGSIGILPSNAGYWTISFDKAHWTLVEGA